MNTRAEPVTARPGGDASSNLAMIKVAWAAFEEEGPLAAMEILLRNSHDDVESRPYSGEGRVLRGADEIRAFFHEASAAGTQIKARARDFETDDDSVIVRGSIRVVHADGSFAETQVRWYYHFDGGRVDVMGWEPRAGS
jgi:hypothetical protein